MNDTTIHRSRILCGIVVALLIPLGLATRMQPWMPDFARIHAGDTLWAAMVYWGLAFVFPRASVRSLTLLALAFSFSIEVSQLSNSPVLVQARSTKLGALVLGHGFLWIDLLRYVVGIALAALMDISISKFSTRAHHGRS